LSPDPPPPGAFSFNFNFYTSTSRNAARFLLFKTEFLEPPLNPFGSEFASIGVHSRLKSEFSEPPNKQFLTGLLRSLRFLLFKK
ncbi:MAG: hypothetical protein LBM92_05490, partial [Opitutaceae bacterium]|nr:hypothetical protein [Opitutaceae bacterium]